MKIKRPYAYEAGKLAAVETENGKYTRYHLALESVESDDYLCHHGKKNQRWGIRNGPPYPLGEKILKGYKERQERKAAKMPDGPKKAADMSNEEMAEYNKRKSLENQYNKLSGQDKTKTERAKDLVDSTANSTRQLKNMLNEGGNQRPEKIRPDLSGKTDKELRDAINRENLERQYTELFGEEKKDKIAKGKKIASKILEGTTGALTLTSLGLSIAIGVKALKG